MKNILIILVFMISIKGYGQTELDTIRFKTIKTKTIDSIESLEMKIIDTLIKPKAYILTKNENAETIAIKKGGKYLVFELLLDHIEGYITKIEQIQVNGKNYKELVVYWTDVNGHSGIGGGLREETRGIIIYDLRKKELIFENEIFWLNHNWGNEILENGELSTSEVIDCYNYNLKFSNKEIIMELKTSKDCDNIDLSDFEITKWNYKLKKRSFIGKGIKTTGKNGYK